MTICVLLGCIPNLWDVIQAIDAFSNNPDGKFGQFVFETKKIHRSNSTFSRLVLLVEQRTDKSLGGRGVYPRKNFFNEFARTGKTAQYESGGRQLSHLAPPGGANGNIPIERVSSIRVLGTIINENLSRKDHMLSLKNKLRATLGAVIKVKPLLSKNSLLVLYHSLLLSHIRYCITNSFHGNLTIVRQLQNICNKFIRMSFSLASEDDISPFMRRHNLLTIKDIFTHDVAIIMYKYHQGALPSAFDDMFRSRISLIKTRSNSQLVPAFCRNSVSQQSIRYVGPKVWSEIPIAMRKSRTISAFKKNLKQYLLNSY